MKIRYLIVTICTIICGQSTISAFSFKKLYASIIPPKLHQEITYEEHNSKKVTMVRLKNTYGNIIIKTDTNHI